MEFRQAVSSDLDDIMRVAAEGREFLESKGVDQWKFGYPQREIFEGDIAKGGCYVGVEDGSAEAVATILVEQDDHYLNIEDGKWLTRDDTNYAVIHRMAVSGKMRGKGCAGRFLAYLTGLAREKGAVSLRADTHEDNKIMRAFLPKHGFTYCGRVYIEYRPDYAAHWVAFEKLL